VACVRVCACEYTCVILQRAEELGCVCVCACVRVSILALYCIWQRSQVACVCVCACEYSCVKLQLAEELGCVCVRVCVHVFGSVHRQQYTLIAPAACELLLDLEKFAYTHIHINAQTHIYAHIHTAVCTCGVALSQGPSLEG
jgi:hypothetical protein